MDEVLETLTLPVHENILSREHQRLRRQIMSELESKMLPADRLLQKMQQDLEVSSVNLSMRHSYVLLKCWVSIIAVISMLLSLFKRKYT